MFIPIKTSIPINEFPKVTALVAVICTVLMFMSPQANLVERINTYCTTEGSEYTTSYFNELMNEINPGEILSCFRATTAFLILDVNELESEIELTPDEIQDLQFSIKELKNELNISSYRTFDPSHFSIINAFTSIFYHGGWMHLIGNLFILILFGSALEALVGPSKYFLIFALSGIGANIIYALVSWAGLVPGVPSLGASAGIYGILAGIYRIYPTLRVEMLFFFFTIFRTFQVSAKLLIGCYLLFDIIRIPFMSSYGTNFIGHVAGFACVYLALSLSSNKHVSSDF